MTGTGEGLASLFDPETAEPCDSGTRRLTTGEFEAITADLTLGKLAVSGSATEEMDEICESWPEEVSRTGSWVTAV